MTAREFNSPDSLIAAFEHDQSIGFVFEFDDDGQPTFCEVSQRGLPTRGFGVGPAIPDGSKQLIRRVAEFLSTREQRRLRNTRPEMSDEAAGLASGITMALMNMGAPPPEFWLGILVEQRALTAEQAAWIEEAGRVLGPRKTDK